MRVRIAVASALLFLPAALSAQRMPLPADGRRGPARPQPLPPQIAPVSQVLEIRRSHLSVESYPMVSFIDSPGLTSGLTATWTTVGMGARADYSFSPFVSGTLDLTSSRWGGPARVQTAELGTRLHRERTESRWNPYLDLRVGYVSALAGNLGSIGTIDPATPAPYGVQYSDGFGAIGGIGAEYWLSRMFSLTTAVSVMRGRMSTQDFQRGQFSDQSFPVTALRYTIALRFNPVRVVRRTLKNDATRPFTGRTGRGDLLLSSAP